MKGVKSFNFLKTLHSQPLSEKGRENWDKIFGKEKESNKQPKKEAQSE